MIQLKIEDTLIDIIEKIELSEKHETILHFPIGHPILHNHLSLKIIKSKSLGKNLIIKTNDKVWRKICKSLSINTQKETHESSPWNINYIEENFSFSQYSKYLLKKYKNELSSFIKDRSHYWNFEQKHSNKQSFHFFIFIPIIALFLFFAIYYLAISRTYIYISPETSVKKQAHNFILSTSDNNSILWNNNTVKLKKISEKIYSSQTYSATKIDVNNSHISKGIIEIINKSEEDISLRPKTRFINEEWIIFRTNWWASIPAWSVDNFWKIVPGKLLIQVKSDIKDSSWELVWERWNIKKSSKLTLPWLPSSSQDVIYAIANEDFSGGKNEYKKIISADDIKLWKELFIEKLKQEAYNRILSRVKTENKMNSENFQVLTYANSITYSNIKVEISPKVQAWDEWENFSYNGNIEIAAYIYNADTIIQKLKSLFKEKSIFWVEKIKNINHNSLRMSEVLYSKTRPVQEIKATFEMEWSIYRDINEEGNSYTDFLKSKIKGLDIEQAENILINDRNIRQAKIENRPFFIRNVSTIESNIYIKVQL